MQKIHFATNTINAVYQMTAQACFSFALRLSLFLDELEQYDQMSKAMRREDRLKGI
ncbi:hypothetical protein [Photobacterium sp. TY1-4]|uniref:hypothetical protein n=1 Tax=Photobacterium sp. TY1-4 TaxID=2899122 RepID=UPI0021C08425|nr:hypothetical protein [Photobacterium sp. TY1-4]UXI00517.1 hypothetical protein NH461_11930 [Photobacterium sp. TY1-4]